MSTKTLYYVGSGNYKLGFNVLKKLSEINGGKKIFHSPISFNRYPEKELDNRLPNYPEIEGSRVFLIQSMYKEKLMVETLDFAHAIKHQYRAKQLIGVILFMWYRRQDARMTPALDGESLKPAKPEEFQRLKMLVEHLRFAGMDDIIVVTPHSPLLEGYCRDCGMGYHEVDPSGIFVEEVKNYIPDSELNLVSAYSPDEGSIGRAVKFAKILGCPVLFNIKKRKDIDATSMTQIDKEEEIKKIESSLRQRYNYNDIFYSRPELVVGKILVMVEDEVASATTCNSTAKYLVNKLKAKWVILASTHPVLNHSWKNKLFDEDPIYKIIMANTIRRGYLKSTGGRIVDVDIASKVASAMYKLHT